MQITQEEGGKVGPAENEANLKKIRTNGEEQ